MLLFFCWLAGAFLFLAKATSGAPQSPNVQTEAIVVLTGGNDRVHTGLALWADGMAPELFISGVNELTSRNSILAQWNGDKRLPFCCITLGYEAKSTIGNAAEIQEWIRDNHIRSVRLVTSDYHMPRARLELIQTLREETQIYVHPVPETENFWHSFYIRYLIFEEYHKYLWRNFQILTGYKGEPWKLL